MFVELRLSILEFAGSSIKLNRPLGVTCVGHGQVSWCFFYFLGTTGVYTELNEVAGVCAESAPHPLL